eukprot:3039835-Alexandrium_andersonii.AAC.1
MQPLAPNVDAVREFIKLGRVGMYLVDVGSFVPVRFINVYSWSGSQCKKERHDASVCLLSSLVQEIESDTTPCVLLGDINCDYETIPALRQAVEVGSLIDIASRADLTGQDAPLNTCVAHGSLAPTRRDYVFIQPTMRSWVQHVYVHHDA